MNSNNTHEPGGTTDSILDVMPIGIRIVRLEDGKLVYANKASMDIFGCTDFERDVAGKSAFDFMPEIQPNGVKTTDMAAEFLSGGTKTLDFACFKLSGEPFTARITSCNVNYNGAASSLAVIEDITEWKRTEDALQKTLSESHEMQNELEIQKNTLQTMINSMPDFVFGKNLNSEYTLLNQSAADYLHVDKDKVIGKNDVDGLNFPAEVAAALIAQDKRIFDGEPKFAEEHWIPAGDGVKRYYETMKAPIIQDGVIIGLVGTSRDITEKKEMEDALREANFKARNARIQEFISKFSVPFTQPYDFDKLINNALLELRDFTNTDRAIILEYQTEDTLQCTYENLISEEPQTLLGDSMSYEERKPIFDEAERTGCFYRKDSVSYLAEHGIADVGEKSFCCIPLMIEGERAGYLVFFTIFEHADWEEGEFRLATMAGSIIAGAFSNRKKNMLKEQALKAQQASEAKSNFLSVMSHEMRTPLNAIIGMTIIAKDAAEVERKNYALNKIEDASTSLLGIVNDVLDMAKIEANRLELSPIEYSVERMLQKVLSVVKFRMDEKLQKFEMIVDDKVPRYIIGDDQRLSQVVTNLLTNASKFTPEEGEISLHISLQSEQNKTCELRFEIIDNGIGISASQQARLFEAFLQAESGTSRTFGGTGLGLALCKRIVELMGGEIWVESELGKGARFIFTAKVERSENDGANFEQNTVHTEKSYAK
ncbi:MAG: ATP-binding protein, partial [Oscillospiraceae bacterium]|nr:ATP-binding protein [Oscillospiraceae bacterium]